MLENIKVVQVNTGIKSNSSPYRIHLALKKIGLSTRLMVRETTVDDENIREIESKLWYRILRKMDYILLNIEAKRRYTIGKYMPFSFYRIGIDISKEREIKEAEIIQLHWVCGTFLSCSNIKKIANLGKPIIIVCHDNWPFTGGCHVIMGCDRYQKECGYCPQLKSNIKRDWSYRLLKKKAKILVDKEVIIVSPSKWMDNNVGNSALFKNRKHFIIPNPINTDLFKKLEKGQMRKKLEIDEEAIVLTFGAVNAINSPYKGYNKLLQTLEIIENRYEGNKRIDVVVFGAKDGEQREGKKINIRYTGFLNENEMVELYNCANVYVVPSLEDSFNNTVAECLACETPVVSFATGGIVDIIEHKENGYLAKYNDVDDLANGILWVINNNLNNVLGKNGRNKIIKNFSEEIIAMKYFDIYKSVMEEFYGR